jgi:hypothetical protein
MRMANKEHLEIIKQGVKTWNRWRIANPRIKPNLTGVNLRGADLILVDFSDTNLSGAKLFTTNLFRADFREANLSWVNLRDANLKEAGLSEANLYRARLDDANLTKANLSDANLDGAYLIRTNLVNADLSNANFSMAGMEGTIFGNADLRDIRGLETVHHWGPSNIDIETIYRSKGKIPEKFLRGVGMPDNFIIYIPSLTEQPIEFYSCFISYSSKNQAFVERLHADLQDKGVRCWFAPEDLKIGDKIRLTIDESIRVHDKLLLVLSEESLSSQWVENEVETAFEREREQHRTVLFPIRLDNSVMEIKSGWPADIRRTRHIGDFQNWQKYDEYQKALGKLLRDLEVGISD